MGIVAISQTLGSLGEDIGRAVADSLGYRYADREIILRAATQFGEGVDTLEHLTEARPTLWERLSESRRRYLAYVEAVIWEGEPAAAGAKRSSATGSRKKKRTP